MCECVGYSGNCLCLRILNLLTSEKRGNEGKATNTYIALEYCFNEKDNQLRSRIRADICVANRVLYAHEAPGQINKNVYSVRTL